MCGIRTAALWGAVFIGSFEGCFGGPVDGMKCRDGTVLKGVTGPERYLQPEMFCKMFPKHPWQYPPLGYGATDKGVQFPFECERQMGGWVYTNPGKPACPNLSPEQITDRCMTSDVPREIIRDMACVVMRDPAKLGKFMNNRNKNRSLIEFAAVMAHLGQETGDLRTIWEQDGNAGQYCDYYHNDPEIQKYCDTALFFGRGVHQLTHPANYYDFSEYWFKDGFKLLEDPDDLIRDMELAWGSAIWFWMEPRQHHNGDASCAEWSLMHDALFSGFGFGETISTINGGIECSGLNQVGPWQRLSRFIYFMDVLGVPMPWVTGDLVTLPKFFTEGCSFIETTKLKIRRATWKELEGGGECSGFNQPYPCGWGGLQSGPAEVPDPLIAFKTGGGFTQGPSCPVVTSEKPNQAEWPYNIAPDEGYYPIDGGEETCEDLAQCYARCKDYLG